MSLAGLVLLTRHGDRQGFYQSPKTYTATATSLTVLGRLQENKNGIDLRNMYLANNNITGLNNTVFDSKQVNVMADGGGEGTVIVDSATALLQGLYPPSNDSIVLANGTTVSWDRAQLTEVETIEPDQAVYLEGWTSCNSWTERLNEWYKSPEFVAQAKIANPFFASLKSVLGNRPTTLENAWNLFDFLNVESIHNATIASQITPEQLSQAHYWANYHEAGSFSDPDLDNIGNIAGQAVLSPLISSINSVANATNPTKISYLALSYKPFLSLFNMWGLPAPLSNSVVDYASAAVIEVRTDNTMRLLFRNGTDSDFTSYALFGSNNPNSYPIADFMTKMQPYSLNTLSQWCDVCQTTNARGCSPLAALNGTGGAGYASIDSTTGRHHVSPVVAGVIGAMTTLGVAIIALALWLLLSTLFRRRRAAKSSSASVGSSTRQGSDHAVDMKEEVPVSQQA